MLDCFEILCFADCDTAIEITAHTVGDVIFAFYKVYSRIIPWTDLSAGVVENNLLIFLSLLLRAYEANSLGIGCDIIGKYASSLLKNCTYTLFYIILLFVSILHDMKFFDEAPMFVYIKFKGDDFVI